MHWSLHTWVSPTARNKLQKRRFSPDQINTKWMKLLRTSAHTSFKVHCLKLKQLWGYTNTDIIRPGVVQSQFFSLTTYRKNKRFELKTLSHSAETSSSCNFFPEIFLELRQASFFQPLRLNYILHLNSFGQITEVFCSCYVVHGGNWRRKIVIIIIFIRRPKQANVRCIIYFAISKKWSHIRCFIEFNVGEEDVEQ